MQQPMQKNRNEKPRVRSKKKNILIGVLVLIIVVAVVVAAIVVTNTLETNQVQVKVSYSGSWSGSYGTTSSFVIWKGTGDKTVIVNKPSGSGKLFIVSATAQKQDDSSNTLTISILKMDGTVLQTASTSDAYGSAQVSVDAGSP